MKKTMQATGGRSALQQRGKLAVAALATALVCAGCAGSTTQAGADHHDGLNAWEAAMQPSALVNGPVMRVVIVERPDVDDGVSDRFTRGPIRTRADIADLVQRGGRLVYVGASPLQGLKACQKTFAIQATGFTRPPTGATYCTDGTTVEFTLPIAGSREPVSGFPVLHHIAVSRAQSRQQGHCYDRFCRFAEVISAEDLKVMPF